MKLIPLVLLAFFLHFCGSPRQVQTEKETRILTGADQTEKYIPLLQGKRVAIMANPTTVIGSTHLVDSLQKRGVNIVKVFGPEHGFRGNASAGVHVADETDPVTGIPVISLYGSKNKPSKAGSGRCRHFIV